MKSLYACTYIGKHAEVDDFNKGCLPESHVCVMSEGCNIVAPSLKELIEKLNSHYCLDIDEVWLPEDESRMGYSRLETVDGYEPCKDTIKKWKRGKTTLYLADYNFRIEKRTVEPVSQQDFEGSGVNFYY